MPHDTFLVSLTHEEAMAVTRIPELHGVFHLPNEMKIEKTLWAAEREKSATGTTLGSKAGSIGAQRARHEMAARRSSRDSRANVREWLWRMRIAMEKRPDRPVRPRSARKNTQQIRDIMVDRLKSVKHRLKALKSNTPRLEVGL